MVSLTDDQKNGLNLIIAKNFKEHSIKNTKSICNDEITFTIKNKHQRNQQTQLQSFINQEKKKDNDSEKKSSNAMGSKIYEYIAKCLKDSNENVLDLRQAKLSTKFNILPDEILSLIIKKIICCNGDDDLELIYKNQIKLLLSDNPPEIRQDQIDIVSKTQTFKKDFGKFIDPSTQTVNVSILDTNTKKLINKFFVGLYKKKINLIRGSKQKLIAECCITTSTRQLLLWLNQNHSTHVDDNSESIIPCLVKKLANHYKLLIIPKIQQDNFDKAFHSKDHVTLNRRINILNEMSPIADHHIYKLPYHLDFFSDMEILPLTKFNKHKRSTNNIEIVSLQNDYKLYKKEDPNNAHYIYFDRKNNTKEYVFDYLKPPNANKEEQIEFNKKTWAERMIEFSLYAKETNLDCDVVAPYQVDLGRVYMLQENNNMNKTNEMIKFIKTNSTGIGSMYKYMNKENKEKSISISINNVNSNTSSMDVDDDIENARHISGNNKGKKRKLTNNTRDTDDRNYQNNSVDDVEIETASSSSSSSEDDDYETNILPKRRR